MTAEFVTRRAAREARVRHELEQRAREHAKAPQHQKPQHQAPQHRAPSRHSASKHALLAHQTEAVRNNKRSKRRAFTATSIVSVVLLGTTALVTVPANASPISSSATVYANQLLAATKLPPYHPSQSLTVSAQASPSQVDQTSFSSAIPTKSLNANNAPPPGHGSPIFTPNGHANIDWAALVLSDAGLPVTANNVTTMLQWMDSENAPQSWYLRNNPLNNGLGSGGGAGFGSYPNLSVAAAYVAKQLDRGLFSGIAAALEANSSPSVTAQAIMASPWATGHYGYGSHWHAVNVPVVTAPASDW